MTNSRATIRDSTSSRANRVTTAGIIWICAAQFFVAQVVAQSRWTTPFSLATNYISDLGNTTCGFNSQAAGVYVCSPWHILMNMSFVLQGVIILAGAVLARPAFSGRRWAAVVFVLLVVTGLCIVGVGVFPADVNNEAHAISAGTQFITGNTALIVFGVAANREKRWRAFALVSSALGIAGILATMLFVQGYGLGLGAGGMERVAAHTLPVWLITSGVLMVRKQPNLAPPNKIAPAV
jgi:hypothetical membrane protein